MNEVAAELPTARIGRTISVFDLESYAIVVGAADQAAGREVPGGLLLGLMSAASSVWCERSGRSNSFSYGYDELRLGATMVAGDTATVVYAPREWTDGGQRLVSDVDVRRQDGAIAASARHILWFPPSSENSC